MPTAQDVFAAITNRDLKQLNQLISDDNTLASSRNDSGVSALMTAAYHQNADMVKLIQESLSELDIFEATSLGVLNRVQELSGNPKNIEHRSGDGFTPLHFAAFFNKPEVARLLIALGSDVNEIAENASCVQPLHSAAASKATEIVRVLLENGADPNAVQHGGWTALHSASKQGEPQMIEILLQHGADPNQPAENGETAITVACNDSIRSSLVGE